MLLSFQRASGSFSDREASSLSPSLEGWKEKKETLLDPLSLLDAAPSAHPVEDPAKDLTLFGGKGSLSDRLRDGLAKSSVCP